MADWQAAEAPKPNYDRLRAEVEAGAYPFYAEDEGELFARAEWLEALARNELLVAMKYRACERCPAILLDQLPLEDQCVA